MHFPLLNRKKPMLASVICLTIVWTFSVIGDERPNILWITAEDMSPTLGCYGDAYALTPYIDQLAQESTKFTHAFATSPVCSPSRACLINGLIAPSQGAHQMRSTYQLPERMLGFPKLLRDIGYFTSNNVKTDYNSGHAQSIIKASWNENSNKAHWRNRKSDQPFFSIFNIMTSHQSRSMVWSDEEFVNQVQSKLASEEVHAPDKAPIPPYYPDNEVVRKTVARYYDCVTAMDKEVGVILNQLKEDGLEDDTIVFFYSDHGSGMPRHKRIPLDSGMHVPLLIRVPDKFQHLIKSPLPKVSNRIVTFEDFGPTVLSIVGVEPSDYMQGIPFLGSFQKPARKYAFGHRDRIDEVVDLSRSVRSDRYLYVRNYMPHLTWNQQSAWPDQGEINHVFYQLGSDKSGLNRSPAQNHYVGSRKPLEELYDCQTDPDNLFNLAESAAHQKILKRLRNVSLNYILQSKDLGFIAELEMAKIQSPLYSWARENKYSPKNHVEAASLVGSGNIKGMIRLLESSDPSIRYWGAVALAGNERLNKKATGILLKNLRSEVLAVAIESADALIRHQSAHKDEALNKLIGLLDHKEELIVLRACRTIEMLGKQAISAKDAMEKTAEKYRETTNDLVWYIQFATSGFLNRI